MMSTAWSRLPLSTDLPQLLAALASIPDAAWQTHFNTDYYHGDWSGVALISASDARTELSSGQGASVPRGPWLEDERWGRALDGLGLEIVCARLLRLGPGGRIHEHRDYDLGGPDGDLRLHIPLLSPPAVDFLLEGARMPMQAGECWFLDLSRPHSVANHDCRARIHLVLDCRPSPRLQQLIVEGLADTPAPGVGRADEAFAQFCRLLAEDPRLSHELQGVSDSQAFVARSVELGSERGLSFSAEHVRAAMRRGRQRWLRV